MSGEPASGQQVVIHIEELVVHGVDVGSRRRLGAAVEAELARLLAQPGALAHLDASRTVDLVDAGAISLGPRPRRVDRRTLPAPSFTAWAVCPAQSPLIHRRPHPRSSAGLT
ncbi:MAG: hypothetical protein R2851_19670 [Caldilineaceae bacterium]